MLLSEKIIRDSHKIVDVEGSMVPKSLVEKLNNSGLYTYKDTQEDLKEHLYSSTTIKELEYENKAFYKTLNPKEREFLTKLVSLVDGKQDGAYFRFVFI